MEYNCIRIKSDTKDLIDSFKARTGKTIWFIVDEAIKEYVKNHYEERERK